MGFNATINLTRTQNIQATQTAQGGSQGTQGVNPDGSPLADGENNFQDALNANGGMMYRSSASKMDVETSSTQVAPSTAEINDAKNQTKAGKAMISEVGTAGTNQENATQEFDAVMNSGIEQIGSNQSVIGGKSAQMQNSGKIIEQITAKQQQIAAWLENSMPSIAEMNDQIDALTEEAIGQIPQELGISAETLEDAIAQLSELVDEDKLEELTQAQERSAEIDEQLQDMDPEDPEYAQLQSEQEGLQTVLQDPDNQTTLLASQALGTLADYSDAISEIAGGIDELNADIEARSQSIASNESAVAAENSAITSANRDVVNMTRSTENLGKELEDESDSFMDGYDTTMQIAEVANTTGSVCKIAAVPLMAFTPTAAVGTALNYVGIGLGIGGGATETVANVAAGVHTGDMTYFAKAATSAATTAASAVASFSAGSDIADAGVKAGEAAAEAAKEGATEAAKVAAKNASKDLLKAAVTQVTTELGNGATQVTQIGEHKNNKDARAESHKQHEEQQKQWAEKMKGTEEREKEQILARFGYGTSV